MKYVLFHSTSAFAVSRVWFVLQHPRDFSVELNDSFLPSSVYYDGIELLLGVHCVGFGMVMMKGSW